MTSAEGVAAFLRTLEERQVPYMLVGSYSTNVYSFGRMTNDVDIVVEVTGHQLVELLRSLGPEFVPDTQMSFESVTGTTRHIVKLRDTPFLIELFLLSDDAHDRLRFGRRVRVPVSGQPAWVATAEDAIITKLRWASRARRTKDHDDIAAVIAAQRDSLDWDYIHKWSDTHGTRGLLDQIRASIPPGG